MTNGQRRFLVDTNVFVYMYDNAAGARQARAIEVLRRIQASESGALSTQILGEFFNTVTRKIREPLTPSRAAQEVIALARSWHVFVATPVTVAEAVGGVIRHQFGYWDALVWATAKLNGVRTVVSEDFSSGTRIEGVSFLNPFEGPMPSEIKELRRRYAIRNPAG